MDSVIARAASATVRTVRNYLVMDELDLAALRIPSALRARAREILTLTDETCQAQLDDEYAHLCRELVARLARKRPSPLARGGTQIWAAGTIYALGRINFLFDRTQEPHLSADQLAELLGVAKTTMANKATLIEKVLAIGLLEPGLTRAVVSEQLPFAWMVELNGLLVDARTLPPELQDEARRPGLIPEQPARRAAA